jgi:hypothetical protein
MPRLSVKASSLDFRNELQNMAASFAGRRTIAATVTVPFDLRWWYWLEYGTATESTIKPTGEYIITPENAKALRFPDPEGLYGGGWGKDPGFAYLARVHHPGIRPRHIVSKIYQDNLVHAISQFQNFFATSKIRGDLLKQRLETVILPYAIELIKLSLDIEAPGVRTEDNWGRLKGKAASEVFGQDATITDTSS